LIEKIATYHLADNVFVHGNVDAEILKAAYRESHFLLFFSKSEGWPKAVAEAMWWGCVPVTTPVSCVPWMIQSNARGILLTTLQSEYVSKEINMLIKKPQWFESTSQKAQTWAREYSLDSFQLAIQKLF
jgi:glycosyltransferase involved in cell wall biosynthesis